MSSGHRHQESPTVGAETLDKITSMPAVRERLWQPRREDNSFSVPYIAGYSTDGKTLYFDSHLPGQIELKHDGQTRTFDPRRFLRLHEELEKAIIDALGWSYYPSHAVATMAEKRAVLRELGPMWWMPYTHAMDGFASGDEHEKITKVPRDLDMTPYLAPPVNRRLIEAMKKAMGGVAKEPKALARYTASGRPAEHCGRVAGWPKGECEHYEAPNGCEIVTGHIAQRGWCKHWERAA